MRGVGEAVGAGCRDRLVHQRAIRIEVLYRFYHAAISLGGHRCDLVISAIAGGVGLGGDAKAIRAGCGDRARAQSAIGICGSHRFIGTAIGVERCHIRGDKVDGAITVEVGLRGLGKAVCRGRRAGGVDLVAGRIE